MTKTNQTEARLLTPEELAMLVKLFRELRQWSQEQLGEISGLSVRTIQRVEKGQPSDLDTRRALARAFEFEDIDGLNKPYAFPTEEEQKAEKEKFDRENITLTALPLTRSATGRPCRNALDGFDHTGVRTTSRGSRTICGDDQLLPRLS